MYKSRQQLMDESKMVVDDTPLLPHIKRISKKGLWQVEPFSGFYGMGYRWNAKTTS